MQVLGIVGSISADSRTRAAVEVALEAASDSGDITTDVLHLAEYDLVTADGRVLHEYSGDTDDALDLIVESDAYIIGTPVMRAAYSGALKNLLDMIPRGGWQADVAPLANSAVGLIATGSSTTHYLSIDQELRPLLAFFGAHTVGGSVYVYDDHFKDGDIVDEEILTRLESLGLATVEMADAIDQGTALSQLGPQV